MSKESGSTKTEKMIDVTRRSSRGLPVCMLVWFCTMVFLSEGCALRPAMSQTSPPVPESVTFQVLLIGNGDGDVVDEAGTDLCVWTCRGSVPGGSTLRLSAHAFPGSRFVEWALNGELQPDGVFTLTQNSVITARFQRPLRHPGEIYWYSGQEKRSGIVALHEVAIFLDNLDSAVHHNGHSLSKGEIVHHFHPDAVIAKDYGQYYDGYLIFAQSPDPFSFDDYMGKLRALHELPGVALVSPAIYADPDYREPPRLLMNEISVRFPRGISRETIMHIEAKYSLERLAPRSFEYRLPSPLEAWQAANELQESGLVESASPEIMWWGIY